MFRVAGGLTQNENLKTSDQLRMDLNEINQQILNQRKVDVSQKDEIAKIMKNLKISKEQNTEKRVLLAKNFMKNRKRKLKQNGLLWTIDTNFSSENPYKSSIDQVK